MLRLMNRLHRQEKGFTLVELMVVVVILGILVAIGIAMFGGVADDAADKANDANLRTINGAIEVYRAGEGEYPEDIDDMVDANYLQENPDSPYDDTEEAYELVGDPPRAQLKP